MIKRSTTQQTINQRKPQNLCFRGCGLVSQRIQHFDSGNEAKVALSRVHQVLKSNNKSVKIGMNNHIHTSIEYVGVAQVRPFACCVLHNITINKAKTNKSIRVNSRNRAPNSRGNRSKAGQIVRGSPNYQHKVDTSPRTTQQNATRTFACG